MGQRDQRHACPAPVNVDAQLGQLSYPNTHYPNYSHASLLFHRPLFLTLALPKPSSAYFLRIRRCFTEHQSEFCSSATGHTRRRNSIFFKTGAIRVSRQMRLPTAQLA